MQTTNTTRTIYDEIACWYHNQLQESWIHKSAMPALLHLLGGRAGLNHKRVCDLGCGSGIFTREVARAGASVVVGVDISSQLLLCAEQEEEEAPVGITYIQADAHHFTWAGSGFDVVTSNVSLMDMADLPTVARTIAALLRSGGIFACSLLHPCGPQSTADGTLAFDDYHQEGYRRSGNPASVRGRVGSYHRRLATYFKAFAQVGLSLEEVEEPEPLAPTPAAYALYPALLLMRWRKGESATKEVICS